MYQILLKRFHIYQNSAAYLALFAMLVQLGFGLVHTCPHMNGGTSAFASDISHDPQLRELCSDHSDQSSPGSQEETDSSCCDATCTLVGVAVLTHGSVLRDPKIAIHENTKHPVLFVSHRYKSFHNPRGPPTLG